MRLFGKVAVLLAAGALAVGGFAPAAMAAEPAPTVTVNEGATQADPTAVSPIVFDIVFSAPVTGLTAADFSSTGTTADGILLLDLAGSGTTYTASISGMTTAGDVVISLPAGSAQNAESTDSEASTATDNTVVWAPPPPDTTSPTVTVNQGATQADPTATSPIVFDVVFSEPVTGLTPADFSSTGTTAGGLLLLDLAGSGSTYTASISGMTTAGDVVITLPAGAAQDAALNDSASSTATDNTVVWAPPPPDTTSPTVTVNQGATQADPTATSPIAFDVVFSEPVTGLTPSDFSSTGTTAGGLLLLDLAGSGSTYTASISGMTTAGDVVITLPAGAAQDAALNDSASSTATDNTVVWAPPPPDTTSPTVTVNQGATQADPTATSPIAFDVVFSEPVTGLAAADFSTSGSTVGGALVVALTGSGTTYTASVSGMTTAGDVVITLPAGAAQDAASNASTSSTSVDNVVAWAPVPPDTTAPTVTVNQGVTQADPTAVSPIVFDVVFSEPVTGLAAADFSTGGSTAGGTLVVAVAGSGTSYTASVSGMSTAGDVVLTLPAGAAQDAATNASASSTSTDNTVTWNPPPPPDTTAPTVTLEQGATQADPAGDEPVEFTVAFSEPVTGLTSADFSTAGSTAGGALTLTLSGSVAAYTVAVSGMTTAGNIVVSLPAGAAHDAAGNLSAASTSVDNVVAWAPVVTPPPTSPPPTPPATPTPSPTPGDPGDGSGSGSGNGNGSGTGIGSSGGNGSNNGGGLADTGFDPLPIAAIATAALLLGLPMLALRRRTRKRA